MAEQIPFDPGGTSCGNDLPTETNKPEPSLHLPNLDQTRGGVDPGTLDASRYRASTFPSPTTTSFVYAQYNQTRWASGQLTNPLHEIPFNFQPGPYSQQTHDAPSIPTYTAQLHGPFGVQHSPKPTDRRHSVPRYHPYKKTLSDHASVALQENSPVRSQYGRPDTSLRTTGLLAPQPHILQAPKSEENVPPQAVDNQTLTAPPPHMPKVFAPAGAVRSLGDQSQTYGLPMRNSKQVPQANVIMSVVESPYMLNKSAREVFNDEQCDKILWLALHGVPSRAIAHLLTIGSEAIKVSGRINHKILVAGLSTLAQYFVPELATGQDGWEDPDALVQRLLKQGDSMYWSPFLLKHAIDFTFISDDDDSAEQERLRNAKERNAGVKWKTNGNDDYAADFASRGQGRRRYSNQAKAAMGGMMRQASEQEIIEENFGYREEGHEVEVVLMSRWLLKIRELGRLPDRSEVATLEVQGDASVVDENTV